SYASPSLRIPLPEPGEGLFFALYREAGEGGDPRVSAGRVRALPLRLPADRPFDQGVLARGLAQDDHLLGFADLAAAAEIDALLQAHLMIGGAQAPAAPRGQAQQRRHAVLRQAGLHRWVQMEADGKGTAVAGAAAAVGNQPVLAAQLVAAAGQEQAPAMN